MVSHMNIYFCDSSGADATAYNADRAPVAALLESGDTAFHASLEEQLLMLLNGSVESLTVENDGISLEADRMGACVQAPTSRWWHASNPKSMFLKSEVLIDARAELPTHELYECVCQRNVAERRCREHGIGGWSTNEPERSWLTEKLCRAVGYRDVILKPLLDAFHDGALKYVEQHGVAGDFGRDDTYAVIDLQPSGCTDRGIVFRKNHWCKDVLTVSVDLEKSFPDECPNEVVELIIAFARRNEKVDSLLVVGSGQMADTLTDYLQWELNGEETRFSAKD